jgi:hypothetical protein
MTRSQVGIGAAIALTALVTAQRITAQQERACADRSRQRLAVTLARQINTAEINRRPGMNGYQSLSAFPQISIPEGFTAQLVINATGSEYAFSVKDTQDPCGFMVFSDQDQVIYTAQPLQSR